MYLKLKAFILARPLLVLSLLGLLVFGIHLTTAADYPSGWFDEIEIIEMGRFSIFNIHPDWSINLFPSDDGILRPPAPMFHYLAGFVQETLYRVSGSFLPGRLFFLFSIPVTSLLLFCWLRTKGHPVPAALLTAVFFLLDPNATICAHWYRPDLWTTSCAFAVMTTLAITRNDSTWIRSTSCFVAGILTATMLFLWITSMLLIPLIGWEAFQSCRNAPRKALLRDAALFFFGAILAVAILLIPLYPHIPAIVNQYAEYSELGRAGDPDGTVQRIIDFIKIALRSPCIWPLAGFGILLSMRKRMFHVLIFIGLCLLMIATRVYHLRMIQLLPFLFLFAAGTIERLLRIRNKFLLHSAKILLPLAVISYLSLSVVALNYAALPSGNTFAALTERLRPALTIKNPKVYLYDMEHELYYSGRALGWRMYSYAPRNLIFNLSQTADLIDQLDAIVITSTANPYPADAEREALNKHGFKKTSEIRLPHRQSNKFKSLLEDLFYAHGYPDCDIYTRPR